ncbi:MAG TPA: hypothetical protein VGV60_08010 [Candidatus Polarisedimenticolia bacterium]|jgi:hypothetical protein|nr:hypothetical protein [Candidatus Polarisedimenticolia bacterium]
MIQVASLLGAALILAAYAAHQAGRLGRESLAYHIVNAVGGAILFGVAVDASQFGFILLEGAWTAISLYAIARSLKRRARGA